MPAVREDISKRMRKMDSKIISISRNIRFFLLALVGIFILSSSSLLVKAVNVGKVFNINDYGAIAGGRADNSQALLNAWRDACNWKGNPGFGSQVLIPYGVFMVKDVVLKGPCSSPLNFRNTGVLRAAPGAGSADHWINFQYIDRLTLDGRGVYDAQGQTVWQKISPRQLPCGVSLDFVTNSNVQDISLINGKTTHFSFFACSNLNVTKITISAPETSPNTDGVKFAYSKNIWLTDSRISSGDDCVAILTGSTNINIIGISCGPGHGISIGSMGSSDNYDQVSQINVSNCTFTNTSNGIRIKTWATNHPGLVSQVTYQNILVNNVDNPIIIDQNYCPARNCPPGNSRIKINGIKYMNIKGTSRTASAVNLQCSATNPCKVELNDISLKYMGNQPAVSLCSNVHGSASGMEVPKPCF